MTTKSNIVDAEKLTNFAARALQQVGVPEEDAWITANILVTTDLRGVSSHGVAHLAPFYIKRIKEGLIKVEPKIEIFSQAPATAVMDGDRGLGFVVGYRAMMEAIQRADAAFKDAKAVADRTYDDAVAQVVKVRQEEIEKSWKVRDETIEQAWQIYSKIAR